MRRFVVVASVVAVAGALARSQLRGRRSAIPKPVTGLFSNGMAYARWGNGPRTLLVIPGGPGNTVPAGTFLSRHLRAARPLVEAGYTAFVVTRKRGMPQGYTIADIAEDHGQLIAAEFDGRVEAAPGLSTGGMIGLSLAARHPERLARSVIVAAGYVANGPASSGDLTYARLLSEGRPGAALAAMCESAYPSWPRGAARVFDALLAPLILRGAHASFPTGAARARTRASCSNSGEASSPAT
jgi:pimeloyl-ACP methyl ester carboxylesterase